MRVSFNVLGSAVVTLGCAIILQSCGQQSPVSGDAQKNGFNATGPVRPLVIAQDDGTRPLIKAATAESSLIINGGFEDNGGANSTSMTGWTSTIRVLPGWSAANYANSDGSGPISGYTIPTPPEGEYAVFMDQNAPATHTLSQEFTVPAGGATISFDLYLGNRYGAFHMLNTLAWEEYPNQQFRVDLVDQSAGAEDLGAAVLQNLYITASTDPAISGYTTITVVTDPALEGETVRLRFALALNLYFFQVGLDNVCVVQNAIPVDLDVKPGSSTNPINIGAGGNIPVAILGSDELDVTSIDVSSILLGDGSSTGTGVAVKRNGSLHYSIEDIDGDGDMDLMMHFSVSAMVANGDLSSTSTSLTVSGMNNDEEAITGEDDISIVP